MKVSPDTCWVGLITKSFFTMLRRTFLFVIKNLAFDSPPQQVLKYILMHFPDCADKKKSF